ncbi:MAG: phosphoglycolate phosphatase [Pseudomonadota bacterium]
MTPEDSTLQPAPRPAPLRAVVFDLDGTLVDSAPDIAASLNATLVALGRGPLPLPRVLGNVGHGMRHLIARCLADSGGGAEDEALIDRALGLYRAHYAEHLADATRPYPNVPEVLEQLAESGLKLAVCTNKPEGLSQKLLAALDLAPFFPVVVGGDTVAERKPHPAPLLHAIKQLGAAPGDTLFVGDSAPDEGAARAAGARFAFHTEGYAQGPTEDYVAEFRFGRWDAFLALVRRRGVAA